VKLDVPQQIRRLMSEHAASASEFPQVQSMMEMHSLMLRALMGSECTR
jgi:hypothetical protein